MTQLPAFGKALYPFKFLYNIMQVMLCSYMCIEALVQAYKNNYTITPCVPFDTVTAPILPILYIFYVSKVLDFADTVFIILDKKWKQLSFLHVYHHTSIFLVCITLYYVCICLYIYYYLLLSIFHIFYIFYM